MRREQSDDKNKKSINDQFNVFSTVCSLLIFKNESQLNARTSRVSKNGNLFAVNIFYISGTGCSH